VGRLSDYDQYHQPADYGHDAYGGADEAVLTSGGSNYILELRAIYYFHNNLSIQMSQLQDEYGSFPQSNWQVTAVEIVPFKELDAAYAMNTVWGIMDFADQPGGAFAFMDLNCAQILTGMGEDELVTEEGMQRVEHYLMHFGQQFMECWQEVAQFDVQMFPSPTAPDLAELQSMFQGLVPNTPIVKSSFRISQPGQSHTARFVLGIPQAYLLAVGPSLQSVGEMTLSSNDTTYFHERLGYVEDVPVPVTVVLGKAEMTVGDLQNLEEGDVIELDTHVGVPLEVRLGSTTMQGNPGTSPDGRRLAVQIVNTGP
jgi:flagellar motor switch/type III secretory pathway protein FliN